jgi:hypothetical protein
MFEKASRIKLRFNYKGASSVEDLWDLSVENLDEIYGTLRAQQRASETDSLLKKRSRALDTTDLSINIVKHIVEVKQEEANKARLSAANKLKKQKILDIISAKQDEELHSQSIEELSRLVNDLD